MAALFITPISAFSDNYIWAISTADGQAFIVDPGDAAPVQSWLSEHDLTLAGILVTHHHADHTGGLAQLQRSTPELPVYGPAGDHIPQVTHPVKDGDVFEVFGRQVKVAEVPGHTLDHLAYLVEATSVRESVRAYEGTKGAATESSDAAFGTPSHAPLLFCGDALFAAGCGRLFEGTPEMMYTALHRLSSLSADTRVYCAHEYTLSNLRFAMNAEPDNMAIAERYKHEQQTRDQGKPTLPSTISLEQRTNPFLRCHSDCLQHAVTEWAHSQGLKSPTSEKETFALLRQWKDQG